MNKPLASFLLNFGIILFAVYAGPFLLDVFGISGTGARMVSIGVLAAVLTFGFEKAGLLPHLRRGAPDDKKGPDA